MSEVGVEMLGRAQTTPQSTKAGVRGLLVLGIMCILLISFWSGCQEEQSPSWAYMFRSAGYQFDCYEGIGVLISEGHHPVTLSGANFWFCGKQLTLEPRPAVWALGTSGRVIRVSTLTNYQMSDLWKYLHGSGGKESVQEVIRILGITEIQIADAIGRKTDK